MRRLIAGCMPLMAAACAAGQPAPIDVHERFDAPPLPPINVRLLLQPEHRRDQDRYMRAAFATLRTCGEWLGPLPRESVTLVDPAWAAQSIDDGDAVALRRAPWWSTRTAMAPELSTARALSRRCVSEVIDTNRLPFWFVDALGEHVARRAVTPIFEVDNLSPGYAFREERFFHGFVPWFVRIRVRGEVDGGPVPAYRAHPAVRVVAQGASADDVESLAGKTLLALATLERWLGRPIFDAVVTTFVRESKGHAPAIEDFEHTASSVSGQDLAWFFNDTFRSSAVFDYGVERVTSEPEADGSFATTVLARRHGDARFTGSSELPIGRFESGRGMTLMVTFADGQRRIDYWDGRDSEKAFRYRSPARAVSAAIDPDRTLLLDLEQTNNSKTLAPQAGPAAFRWGVRYLIWLEDLLLSYASLV